ncbi:hypothetical protein B1748_35695 [Paenibacillus sp. MY03]|uniref:hypothetical protein n=1 Tax=Paenibacillus sp. MY03 TaxID=302980 RepID=UPI000B3C864A|nr:hypothetical protein [Paenibacillus sp. MY03]OUS67758.1 hypothetical protein B1748_35695 [Paenibacillus sp. MY03]
MAIVGIAAVAACICVLEIPRMWRSRQWKELGLFGFLLALGTGISVGVGLDAGLPNPMDWLAAIFRPIDILVETTFGLRRVNEG